MAGFTLARRGAVLALLVALLSGAAAVVAATPASADPRCTGRIGVSSFSRDRAFVSYYFRNGGSGAITKGEGTRSGSESNPIDYFGTPLDRPFSVDYFDLTKNPARYIRTDNLDYGGSWAINPCHYGLVTVR